MDPSHFDDAYVTVGTPRQRTGRLTVDLGAMRENYRHLSAISPTTKTAAVVKADAYGLGAVRVVQALSEEGCTDFFVAHLSEAEAIAPIAAAGSAIYILNGLLPGMEARCADIGAIPVINCLDQLGRWLDLAGQLGRRLPAVLQFDTGMSRLGLMPQEWPDAAVMSADLRLDIRFAMTHLASADEVDSGQNAAQADEMAKVRAAFPHLAQSIANSSGLLLGENFLGILSRPGIALYAGLPGTEMSRVLRPVVSLEVAVLQVRSVPQGTKVGYGASFEAPRPMRLATLAIGYADGFPRSLSNTGAVYFGHTRLPIVGRVSMDSVTVDISALPVGAVGLGTAVEIIGPHQSLEDVAEAAGTISYEILTRLGHRYDRHYV